MAEISARATARSDRRFGPFLVIDEMTVILDSATDSGSPTQFQLMLAAYPRLRVLQMANCPGTHDDAANLRVGRMIHAQGMMTVVPATGSVRSGAVELFIAGTRRSVSAGAEFAVHSWIDRSGREPLDLAADDPINETYLAYYRDMGLSLNQAKAFYTLTNSVPNNRAIWLDGAEIARYVPLERIKGG